MFGDDYKKAYQEIKPSDGQMDRILSGIKKNKTKMEKKSRWRPALATMAVCVGLVCAVPVCATGIPGFYRVLEKASGKLEDLAVPIEKNSISHNISMQVEAIYLEDTEAEVIISFADVGEENVIRGKVDLSDGYGLQSLSGDSYIAGCSFIEYEEETGKAYFKVMLESEEAFDQEELIFYANGLRCGLTKEEKPIDLSGIKTVYDTKKMPLSGYGGIVEASELPESLWCKEEPGQVGMVGMVLDALPAADCAEDDFTITGMAYLDGILRLQICMGDNWETDRHVQPFLVDEEGNERHEDHSVSWQEEVGDTSYQVYEYWFIGPFNDLENYAMYGIFHDSGEHIEGDWRVKFRLE